MIREAADFATEAHKGMVRKGGGIPYIYHPMEVALLSSQMTEDEEVIAAAYLHDVLEDTSVTAEELKTRFGDRVLALVLAETEDKSRTWQERKGRTIDHLPSAPRDVKILTLADKLSNMRATARDYLMIGDEIWLRFNEKRKSRHQWYTAGVIRGLSDLAQEPAYQELKRLYDFVFGNDTETEAVINKESENKKNGHKESADMLFIEYPKCSTCQKAKKWLTAHEVSFEDRHIAEQNPTEEELKEWTARSGLELKKFFNTSGMKYKELGLKDKLPSMSDDEKIRLLASDGMLVKRPLVIADHKILVGFKEKEWEEALL